MRRELRSVKTQNVIGDVVLKGGRAQFLGRAEDAFRALRARVGDDVEVAEGLIADGWSNGYIALYPLPPAAPLP